MSELLLIDGKYHLKWAYDCVPIELYKYTNLEVLKLILQSNKFLFRCPHEFNDINDCNLEIKTPKDIDKIRKGLMKSELYQHNFIRREAKALQVYNNIEYYDNNNKKISIEHVAGFKIHCFSKNSNSWQCWIEHGKKHSGVCIGMTMRYDDTNFFKTAHNVKYVDEYPILNSLDFLDTEKNTLIDLVTTKLNSYCFEDEIRIWKDSDLDYYEFNKHCLFGICFGYKLNNNYDAYYEIVELIRKYKYKNVKLYQALKVPDEDTLMYQSIDYKFVK